MLSRNWMKKTIGWLVLCSFILLLHSRTAPLRGADSTGGGEVAAAADTLEPGTYEKTAVKIKPEGRKKTPWLLIGAGALVVAGIVIYFTLIQKPKYVLTVSLGQGVSGSPAAGSFEYKKGTEVDYAFSAASGYKKLAVTLDGAVVEASGKVTMDKPHALAATTIEGIDEQFVSSASPLWQPWHPAAWSVADGCYKCSAMSPNNTFEHNVLDYRIPQDQFIVETRLRKTTGAAPHMLGIALTTSAVMSSASGYLFVLNVSSPAQYAVFKFTNLDFRSIQPTPGPVIQNWTKSTFINFGTTLSNRLTVTRAGSYYALAVNRTNIFTFTDSDHDVRYLVELGVVIDLPNGWEIDHATVSIGSTPTAPPFRPAASGKALESGFKIRR